MNTAPLNSRPLGSASSKPWISAAAEQLFRLVGAVSVSLTKYGTAAGSLALTGSARVLRRTWGAIAGTLSLSGGVVFHNYVKTYASSTQLFAIGSMATPTVRRGFGSNTSLALGHSTVVALFHLVRGEVAQAMSLGTSVTGYDLTTTSAPDERTTGVVELKTIEVPTVTIGG